MTIYQEDLTENSNEVKIRKLNEAIAKNKMAIKETDKEIADPQNKDELGELLGFKEKLIMASQGLIDDLKKLKKQSYTEEVDRLIAEFCIHSIPSREKFFIFKYGSWHELGKEGLSMALPSIIKPVAEVLKEKLEQQNRDRIGVYCGINDKPNYLNLMVTDGWLKPKDYGGKVKVTEYFDLLMTCLSGGRKNVRDHIEKCIIRKVVAPDDFLIPCLSWYGQGGIGKNLFVNSIMKSIFNGAADCLTVEKLTGNFQSRIKYKLCIQLEEVEQSALDMRILKSVVGNPTLTINEKCKMEYEQDNYCWWLIGTNNRSEGPVRLDNGMSDRRWSIIKALAGYSLKEQFNKRYPDLNFAEHRYNIAKILADKEQIEQWLYDLIAIHGMQKHAPDALQDEDYKEVVEYQKTVDRLVCDLVFKKIQIQYITSKALYEFYVKKGGKLQQNTFGARVTEYMENKFDEQHRWTKKTKKMCRTPVQSWVNPLPNKDALPSIDNFDDLTLDFEVGLEEVA